LSLGPTGHKNTSTPLELIFSDVWGPAPLFSSNGHHYFVIFVDAYTKCVWYYPLVAKSDVYSVFHQFQTLVEHQFSLKIKSVQTKWGNEYRKLSIFFQTVGIHHRLICPHTHEQNGTVECYHRHIVETGLTILGKCKAPFRFWNYAFETSIYLINCMLTPVLAHRSPFDYLFHRSPDYHFLRTFGCLCFPFLHPYNNYKLDFCSSPCVFFGYSSSHLGYQCFDIASHRIYISCHVRYYEHVFSFDNSEQIAKVSTTTPIPPVTVTLPNLLNHPPPPTSTSHPNSHSLQLCHSKQPPDHSPQPSLSHHHMLVYLTLMMQIQFVNWYPLLMVLRRSLVHSLLCLPWLTFLPIWSLPTAPLLLTVLCWRPFLHHPLSQVYNLWLIYLLISCHRSPHCHHLPLRLHQYAAAIL